MNRTWILPNLILISALCLPGCGAKSTDSEVETLQPEAIEEEEIEEESGGMEIVGLTGSLSRDEVVMVMNDMGIMKLEMCLNWIYTKRDYMFGDVEFLFTVKPNGKTQEVKITQSDLGDYELEKCLVKKLQFTKFPKPKGGGTEVTYSFAIDPPKGTRKPDLIGSTIVKNALEEFKDPMKECTGTKLKGLKLILYLGETYSEEVEVPGKKNKFKTMDFCHVLALGGTPPEGSNEDSIKCILDAAKSWKVPLDAGTYVRKGTVEY